MPARHPTRGPIWPTGVTFSALVNGVTLNVVCATEVQARCGPGDSGAPVFERLPNGKIAAQGILIGSFINPVLGGFWTGGPGTVRSPLELMPRGGRGADGFGLVSHGGFRLTGGKELLEGSRLYVRRTRSVTECLPAYGGAARAIPKHRTSRRPTQGDDHGSLQFVRRRDERAGDDLIHGQDARMRIDVCVPGHAQSSTGHQAIAMRHDSLHDSHEVLLQPR